MRRCVLPVGLALLAGCVHNPKNSLIPATPANGQAGQVVHASPATEATAVRVATLGAKILKANPQMSLQGRVETLGVLQPTIFHRLNKDYCEIFISEGLVNQCRTEGQLAAVLCMELGRAASEKAALNPLPLRRSDIEPPPAVLIGNDIGGINTPDQTHLAELAKVDERRHREEQPLPPPPPPEILARAYLQRAGYAEADLKAIDPLLRAADKNTDIEKQVLGK
jgi:hypothetical protein